MKAVLKTLTAISFVGFYTISPVYAAEIVDEIVTTNTRREQSRSGQSINTSIVDAQKLMFIRATHFNEFAMRVSGVNISRNNGQESLTSIRSPIFTGAGACGAFLTAQDGIALRAAGFCNVNEMFEAFTENAARIEITKGTGSALYGSNALHGIINIVSQKADTDEGQLSLETGSNKYIKLNISKGTVSDNHGVLMNGVFIHDGGNRENSGFDQQKIKLRHDYNGARWNVSSGLLLTNSEQETAGYITGLDAYANKNTAKSNPNPEAYRNAKSLRAHTKFAMDINKMTKLQITPYVRALDMEFLMHFLPGQPVEENTQKSIGVQTGLYMHKNSELEIITGVDMEYTQGLLKQTQAHPTQGSDFLKATIPSAKQYDYEVDSVMLASFVQFDWQALPKLNMQAGARLEYIYYDYTNNMLSGRTREDGTHCGFGGCRYSRPESRKDSFTALSPKLGAVYKIAPTHSLYANLGMGYRAPQTSELYRLQRKQKVAELDTVNLKNAEIGARGHIGKLTYDMSVYAMKKDNIIFRDSEYFNVDNAKSDHIGFDIMVEFQLQDNLFLQGNIGLARHRYTSDSISGAVNINGLDIDTAPRNFGTAQLNWHPTQNITTELEWVHMGSYFLNPENTSEYAGHDYFNLRTSLELTNQFRVFARIMNLTDSAYAERADYTRFTNERYFPGASRTAFIGLSVNF